MSNEIKSLEARKNRNWYDVGICVLCAWILQGWIELKIKIVENGDKKKRRKMREEDEEAKG